MTNETKNEAGKLAAADAKLTAAKPAAAAKKAEADSGHIVLRPAAATMGVEK